MSKYLKKYNENKQLLLSDFNRRDNNAFSYIYNEYYTEFHLYASSLYIGTTIEPKDAVQDAFMYVWENHSLVFNELINIRAYIIIMLKNRYKNYLQRMSCEKRYNDKISIVDNNFEIDVLENRIYTIAEQMLSLLPKDSAEILRLYIEGWKPEEIAIQLEKPIQTIYNKKSEAISLLRKKASHDGLLLFLLLIRMTDS